MYRFIGREPRFDVPPEEGLEKSPYYWWWRYLRNNEEYRRACEAGGAGCLNDLYRDFGDIRDDDFQSWWGNGGDNHGKIFAEQTRLSEARLLKSKSDWESYMGAYPYVVIAVDMRYGLDVAKEDTKKALMEEFEKRGGGKPPIHKRYSTAKYRLTRNINNDTCRFGIELYERLSIKPRAGNRLTDDEYWDAANEIQLDGRYIERKDDPPSRLRTKKTEMVLIAKRVLREATKMVQVTSEGVFPSRRPVEFDVIDRYVAENRQDV